MTDYTILAAPRISARAFAVILERRRSPAAREAAACYRAAVDYGVDPAVLLAVFGHESSYGIAGAAVSNRSWGNLRRSPDYPTVGGFVRYPSWTAGARDAARLLRLYGKNAIRPGRNTATVQTFPYVWAPTADGNAPDAYGDALVRSIDTYRRLSRELAGAPAPVTTATHTTPHNDVRIRAAASTAAAELRQVDAGTHVRGSWVDGRTYSYGGRRSSRWLRITAIGGHPLERPAYSAGLLWREL